MRVLIADDSAAICSALQLALSGQAGFDVVGKAAEWRAILEHTGGERPDVVLLDWGLMAEDADARLRTLRVTSPGVRIVALSANPGDRPSALRAGVDAFVSKADHPDRLYAVLRSLGDSTVVATDV